MQNLDGARQEHEHAHAEGANSLTFNKLIKSMHNASPSLSIEPSPPKLNGPLSILRTPNKKDTLPSSFQYIHTELSPPKGKGSSNMLLTPNKKEEEGSKAFTFTRNDPKSEKKTGRKQKLQKKGKLHKILWAITFPTLLSNCVKKKNSNTQRKGAEDFSKLFKEHFVIELIMQHCSEPLMSLYHEKRPLALIKEEEDEKKLSRKLLEKHFLIITVLIYLVKYPFSFLNFLFLLLFY